MPQYVVTPWKYHSHLLQVRREIYRLGDSAPPADDRRHAVDWIAAWKMRGSLPHAVESTALLVDAVLHHDCSRNSLWSIRATYAAAFCRFVTGYCDIQQNTAYKRHMYDIALEIDMPASFVELRHEATHEELPSLQRLTGITTQALQWLWQRYWQRLDVPTPPPQPATSHSQPVPTPSQLRNELTTFLRARLLEIKANSPDLSATSASGAACAALVRLCRGRPASLDALCGLLVAPKMLVPANRALAAPMIGALAVWDNLLQRLALHQRAFARALCVRLVDALAEPSTLDVRMDAFREAVFLWADHVLCGGSAAGAVGIKSQPTGGLARPVKAGGGARAARSTHGTMPASVASNLWARHVDRALRDQVMSDCVVDPNYWTLRLASGMLAVEDEARIGFRLTWQALVEAAQAAVSP